MCSPGGHLLEMLALETAWGGLPHTWITYEAPDVEHLLDEHEVVLMHGPTNRNIKNLLKNIPLAWRVLRRHQPDVVLSTGAGLALPFFLVGKLMGKRLVYVESFARVKGISLTGRLVYPLCDSFFVQWPGACRHKRAQYVGSVL